MKLLNGYYKIIILLISYKKALKLNPKNEDLWYYNVKFLKDLPDEALEKLIINNYIIK